MLLEAIDAQHAQAKVAKELTAAQAATGDDFIAQTAHWDQGCEAMLRLDANWFGTYAAYVKTAWNTRAIDPVTRELVCIAVNASTTLLHKPGISLHTQRALACGATPGQIMEVLQLTSVLGIHTCSVAMPILLEEMARAGLVAVSTS